MWERIEIDLPPDVAAATTSVWQWPEIMQIGVMRKNFLQPPILWAQVLKAGVRNLRKAPSLLTELQSILHSPKVYAEAEVAKPRNQALLLYLGFREISTDQERKFYIRSI